MKILIVGLVDFAKRFTLIFPKCKNVICFMNWEYFIKRHTWNID